MRAIETEKQDLSQASQQRYKKRRKKLIGILLLLLVFFLWTFSGVTQFFGSYLNDGEVTYYTDTDDRAGAEPPGSGPNNNLSQSPKPSPSPKPTPPTLPTPTHDTPPASLPATITHEMYNAYQNLQYHDYIDTAASSSLLTRGAITNEFLLKTTPLIGISDVNEDDLSDGRILKWDADGNEWIVAKDKDSDTTYEAGSGLTLDDDVFSLGGTLDANTALDLAGFTFTFNNGDVTIQDSLYATTLYQNGNEVCDMSGNCGGGGGVVSWTLAGDSGANQTITNSDTATISGGAGLTSVASATDTLTLNIGAGSGITVGTNDVSVNQAFGFAWTGAQSWSNSADFNGDISIADTTIALDGASTNLNVTGNFSVNTNDFFIQKADGNVGIGNTSPGFALDVTGGIATSDDLYISGIGLNDTASDTTSGASLVGVFDEFTNSSSSTVQEVLADLDAAISGGSHVPVTLAGAYDYLTLTGQQITLNQIDLATDVTGLLSLTNGGTNADLSGVPNGGIIYKGATGLEGSGSLTGVLKGNGASAPTAMTGTTNYVTRWLDANTIDIGVLYDDGNNVGISTTNPGAKLDVVGGSLRADGDVIAGDLYLGYDNTSATISTSDTDEALTLNPNGTGSIFLHGSTYYIDTNGLIYASGLATTGYTPTAGELRADLFRDGDSAYYLQPADSAISAVFAGNVGIGTTSPDFALQVNGVIAPETTDQDLGTSSLRWDIFANEINADSTVTLSGLSAGTDNTILVLNGSNQVVTDEIDPRVWGASLIDGSGTSGYVSYWSDADTLTAEQYLSTLRGGLGGDVTAAGAGEILYSTGTTSYDSLPAGTAGYVLVSNGAAAPTWIDSGALGASYWAKIAGVLSPGLGEPIAATSAATTVATFTATGSNTALEAGGSSAYARFDNSGNLVFTNGSGATIDASAGLTIGGATQTGLILGRTGISTRIANLTTDGVIYTSGTNGTLNSEAQLAISRGGTNSTATPTAGALAYGTGTAYAFSLAGTSGQALLSGGGGSPTWGTLGLTYGGTNADLSAVATGGLIYKAASSLAGTGALTGVLKGNGAGAPTAMTGTTNYVTRWTDANTLGIGMLYDDGTNVGIGTTSPDFALQVNGVIAPETTDQDLGTSSLRWDIFANEINADSTITLTGLNAGVDNTVLVLNGSNQIETREIDPQVWSSDLITGAGTNGYVTYWTGTDTIGAEQYLSTIRGGLGGDVTAAGAGEILYSTGTTTYDSLAAGTLGYVLASGGAGAPTWVDPATLGTNYWQVVNGAISPRSPYTNNADLLLGSDATESAKFAVLNMFPDSGTPIASVSSGLSGTSLFLTADGTLATQNRMDLTLGNSSAYDTTGNILIHPNGIGNVGIGTTAPTGKLDITGSNTSLLSLTHTNTAIENSYGINLTSTPNKVMSGGSSFFDIGASIFTTPDVTITDSYSAYEVWGIDNHLFVDNLTITDNQGDENYLTANGHHNLIQGTMTADNTGAGISYIEMAASVNTVSVDLALENTIGNLDFTSYGGTFANNSSSPGDNGVTATVYGIRGSTGGGLTTTGFTTHYAGYFSAGGVADTNYGLYVESFDAAENYGIYVASGTNYFADNVGIGTSPDDFKLQVAGNIGPSSDDTYDLGSNSLRWRDLFLGGETLHIGSSTTDEGTISYTASNILSFSTDSTTNGDIAFFTDDLYIDKSAGNVGINTTTPAQALHVIGDVRISGLTPSLPIKTNANNDLVSGAIDLASAEVTGLLPLANGGTNADLSGASTGGLIYKGVSSLAASGSLTGVLKGNGSGAPTAMAGTANYVTRWTDAHTIGTGLIYDDGTNVGIGTTGSFSFLLEVAGDIGPETDGFASLGSGSQQWLNIYGENIYQNNNQVCDMSGNCAALGNLWQYNTGALSPATPYTNNADFLIGSIATESAKFAVLNVFPGTALAPSASVSSGLSGTSMFMTADGSLSTTRRSNLTIGNSSSYNTTGHVLINPNGTGNVGIGTINPTSKLTIESGVVEIKDTTANGQQLQFKQTDGSGYRWGIGVGNGNAADNDFSIGLTTGYDYLVINRANGNVGIGTTTPLSSLHVASGKITVNKDNTSHSVTGNEFFTNVGTETTVALYDNRALAADTGGKISFGSRYSSTGNPYYLGASIRSGRDSATDGQYGTYLAFNIRAHGSAEDEALRITSNGNVGIGTTVPAGALDVAGQIRSSGAAGGAITSHNPNNQAATISMSWLSDVARLRVGGSGAGAGNGFDFQTTGDNSLLRILGSGNVGIGTTAPGSKLVVVGNTQISAMSIGRSGGQYDELGYNVGFTGVSDTYTYRATDTAASIRLGEGGGDITFRTAAAGTAGNALTLTERMRIDVAGNVGIGSTTPDAKLEVVGTSEIARFSGGSAPFITVGNGLTSTTGGYIQFNEADDTFRLSPHGIVAMAINSGGNVGIGDTTPSWALDVTGDINTTSWLRTTGDGGLYFQSHSTGLRAVTPEGGTYGSVSTYGNTGGWDGYSLDGKFVFMSDSSDVGIYNDINNRWIMYHDTGTATQFYEPDSSTEVMRIAANGNVGIGTTNPNTGKLQVVVSSGSAPAIYGVHSGGTGVTGSSTTGNGGNFGSNSGIGVIATTASNIAGYFQRTNAGVVGHFINGTTNCSINPGAGSPFACPSDERLKKNISTIDNSLEKILALRGVTFNWKKEANTSKLKLGFIAQEVESIVPELVDTDEDGYKRMDYAVLTPLLVNAIQEQQTQIESMAISTTNLTFSSSGELTISDSTDNYSVTPVKGSPLTEVIGAAQAVIGKITAGLINTQELIVSKSATIANLNVTNLSISGMSLRDYIRSIVQEEILTTYPKDAVASNSAPINGTATTSAQPAGSVQYLTVTQVNSIEKANVLTSLISWTEATSDGIRTMIVNAPTVFKNMVSFEGSIKLTKNTTGMLDVPANTKKARVTFSKRFPEVPTIFLNFSNTVPIPHTISEISENGFSINFEESPSSTIKIQWLAVLQGDSDMDPYLEVVETEPSEEPEEPKSSSKPSPTPSITPTPTPEATPVPTATLSPTPSSEDDSPNASESSKTALDSLINE